MLIFIFIIDLFLFINFFSIYLIFFIYFSFFSFIYLFRFWYTDEDSSATFMNWIVEVSDYEDAPKVFSISYGIPEHYLTFYEIFVFDTEIKKLGLQGVTILSASGKYGMYGNR